MKFILQNKHLTSNFQSINTIIYKKFWFLYLKTFFYSNVLKKNGRQKKQ